MSLNTPPHLDLLTKDVFNRYLSDFSLVFLTWEGTILDLNSTAATLLGYHIEESLGRNVEGYFQFLGTPIRSYEQKFVFEALVNRKDSSVFPAQVHVIPYTQNESVFIVSDLSIRNRLREQLFKEKHLLGTVIDAIQDQVFLLDTNQCYLLNNKSHLSFLGALNQAEVIGKNFNQFSDSHSSKNAMEDNQLILKGIVSEVNRTEEVRPGHWYEIKKTPLIDPLSRSLVGVVGLTRDVTERVNTEEKLRQVQRLESIGILAGGIAHDFNNLLTVVVGLADTASLIIDHVDRAKPLQEAEIRDLKETLMDIRQAGQRAAILTQKLLAVGRKQLVEMKSTSINEIIYGMSSVLSGALRSNERPLIAIQLDYQLENDLPSIYADRSQLEQVLLNLVVNAKDAIFKRMDDFPQVDYLPRLSLKTYLDPISQQVLLEMSDNGCGMSDEVKSKVFDPFFTTKEIGRGTGLGLASVYGILQQSNATVKIDSTLHQGTTFKIVFQRWMENEARDQKTLGFEKILGKVHKILYAEDDAVIRTLVRRNLEVKGYQVIESENGGIAWAQYQKTPNEFSLVLTDLMMPHVSGMEFISSVLKLNPLQKILCVSGYTNEDTKGLPILKKPFTIEKLYQKIQELLE